MHNRTFIRKKVIEILNQGFNNEVSIHDTKITGFDKEDLPAISVAILNERYTSKSPQVPYFEVSSTLIIEFVTEIKDDLSEEIDKSCEKIEDLLFKNQDFLKMVKTESLSTNLEFKDGGEAPIIAAVMSFDINYEKRFNLEFNDDFKTMEITNNEIKTTINLG